MAAWGAKGAWAQQVEEGDAPLAAPPPEAFPTLGGKKADELFPTLDATKSVKQSKKKAKAAPMSLADFNAGATPGGGLSSRGGGAYRPPGGGGGGVKDDDIVLPTGPRAREEGEEEVRPGQLGGAFRDYGGDRGGDRGARPPFQFLRRRHWFSREVT